jgi:hypothetical protein
MTPAVSRHRAGLAIVRVEHEHGQQVVTVRVRVVDDVTAEPPVETELASGDIATAIDALRDWLYAWAPRPAD